VGGCVQHEVLWPGGKCPVAGRAAAAGRAEGRAVCSEVSCPDPCHSFRVGQLAGPEPMSGVRRVRAGGPKRPRAGQWREPMGEWSAEDEALGLVLLKGHGVPGEVGRARVTCRCVTGLGEIPSIGGPDGPWRSWWRSGKQSL
jgi:hypothetical protein